MSIVKCKSHIDVYEKKAKSRDPNELSGRTGRPDLTAFVSESIVSAMSVTASDTVVDIGCGDGTLLRLVSESVPQAIGILPTVAEVTRVSDLLKSLSNCNIREGIAQSTGVCSQLADKVICNGVFILLSHSEVEDAFKEIARISKPGSRIFIGEVPYVNEQEGKDFGDSISLWLLWVLRHQGVGQFITRLKQTLFALSPKIHYYVDPDAFVKLARKFGLIEKSRFRHKEINNAGKVLESETRWNYIFEKEDLSF